MFFEESGERDGGVFLWGGMGFIQFFLFFFTGGIFSFFLRDWRGRESGRCQFGLCVRPSSWGLAVVLLFATTNQKQFNDYLFDRPPSVDLLISEVNNTSSIIFFWAFPPLRSHCPINVTASFFWILPSDDVARSQYRSFCTDSEGSFSFFGSEEGWVVVPLRGV